MDAGVQVYNFSIAGSFPHISSDLFEISSGAKKVWSITQLKILIWMMMYILFNMS